MDDSQKKISNEYSIGYSFSEQLKKIAEPLSNRSDIYSLGMTLYVLANDKKYTDWLMAQEWFEIDDNEILLKGRSKRPFFMTKKAPILVGAWCCMNYSADF